MSLTIKRTPGWVWWLKPVIPVLWEAKADGSPEVSNLRPARPTQRNPISTENTQKKSARGGWGRRNAWTQEAEVAVSWDHATALQPGQQEQKKKTKKKKITVSKKKKQQTNKKKHLRIGKQTKADFIFYLSLKVSESAKKWEFSFTRCKPENPWSQAFCAYFQIWYFSQSLDNITNVSYCILVWRKSRFFSFFETASCSVA